MHSSKKHETDYIDDEIVEWILMNRKLGITVTLWDVIRQCFHFQRRKKNLECTSNVVISVFSK